VPPKLRGKWALGITPRNLTWIIKDKLAICERPGGFGVNHRRVRRQEEIIWLRENDFACVISIIGAPHNLHNYDELNMPYKHRPLATYDDIDNWLRVFYSDIHEMLKTNSKVIVHAEEVSDRIYGGSPLTNRDHKSSDRLQTDGKLQALGGQTSILHASTVQTTSEDHRSEEQSLDHQRNKYRVEMSLWVP